jgi:UDP-N-acetylglucosamine 2-epimerase (non-hydrolysing)
MKLAPLERELRKFSSRVVHKIVHTGQHYDYTLSQIFFKEFNLSRPHIYLRAGSASHSEQTARIMEKFEKVVLKEKPDLVLVFGDVNSTLACSLVCSKISFDRKHTVAVAHVEAGLRSFDRTMPEEINRIVTDSLSEYLLVTEKAGVDNLQKEGVSKNRIYLTGDVMIDTLVQNKNRIQKKDVLKKYKVTERNFTLVTIHRPVNVDNRKSLSKVISILEKISEYSASQNKDHKIIFPVHPRTKKMIKAFDMIKRIEKIKNIELTEPAGYMDFVSLLFHSKVVITDSGGVQEEATFLGIPCLTLRDSFERPETISIGTNTLCALNEKLILGKVKEIFTGRYKKGRIPKLMDGKAAKRIVKIILNR